MPLGAAASATPSFTRVLQALPDPGAVRGLVTLLSAQYGDSALAVDSASATEASPGAAAGCTA